MELDRLFQIQHMLDQKIIQNHQLEGEDLVPAKLLALQVELGELANETRCFKFWSLKPASSREVILEEYVDGLHFIFSVGLDLTFERDVQVNDTPLPENLTAIDIFLLVFEQISVLKQTRKRSDYQQLFYRYIQLGQILGFEWPEMVQAYLNKNEVNHRRQADGY